MDRYFPQKFAGNVLLSYMTLECIVKFFPKYYPENYGTLHSFIEDKNVWEATYNWEGIHRVGTSLLEKLETEPEFVDHFLKTWKSKIPALKNYQKQLAMIDLKRCSEEELKTMFNKMIYLLQDEYGFPMLCDAFGLHSEEILIEKLKKIVPNDNIAPYLSTLISPVFESFTGREAKSLLKIMACMDETQRKKILEGDFTLDPETDSMLDEHVKNYFWITNCYDRGVRVGRDHFFRQMQESFKENIHPGEMLAEIDKKIQRNIAAKEKIMRELNFDQKLRNFIRWIDNISYVHDERKGIMMEAFFYIQEIVREVSRRRGIPMDHLNSCFHFEIFGKMPGDEEIRERLKSIYYRIGPDDFYYCTGEEVEKFRKEILEEGTGEVGREFRGNAASPGVAVGRVRMINTVSEIGRIQKGDVLVTGMTRPDYVIGMKKAVAIVTDEGGITCHAAIVSRELGIPCVIGTRIATKVLKDGMLVEVSGNHGRVKILE